MKLSTRGRYGLRALCYIAEHATEQPVPLSTISEELELSENYLEQLVRLLRKEGLVTSVRGAQGGYLLQSAPETITVGEVLRALEGSLNPSECVVNGCGFDMDCKTHKVLMRIDSSINKAVDTITIKDMLDGSIPTEV